MKTLWLASGSPRRLGMLEAAGFAPRRLVSPVDDDVLNEASDGVEVTCLARAWFKAQAAHRTLTAGQSSMDRDELSGIVLAADTLCEADGALIGKPQSPEEASSMIQGLSGRSHRTITGVALIDVVGTVRSLWSDHTVVRIGELSADDIRVYVESGEWSGKSGGYNLSDRIGAGWPIEIEGDPDTVMGLPMRRLVPRLKELLGGTS